jgi:hypothetical protein
LKLCIEVIEQCGKLGIDGGRLFVHGEAVVIKLLVCLVPILIHHRWGTMLWLALMLMCHLS